MDRREKELEELLESLALPFPTKYYIWREIVVYQQEKQNTVMKAWDLFHKGYGSTDKD